MPLIPQSLPLASIVPDLWPRFHLAGITVTESMRKSLSLSDISTMGETVSRQGSAGTPQCILLSPEASRRYMLAESGATHPSSRGLDRPLYLSEFQIHST